MNNRWAVFVAASLVTFASLAITWQWVRRNGPGDGLEPESCIALSWQKGKELAKIHDLVPRISAYWPGVGTWWTLALVLPDDAQVFLTDMTGPTNYNKIIYYYSASYYLFPREIGVSVDRPTSITKDGLPGETSRSDQEILAKGYDVRLDFGAGEKMFYKPLRELPMRSAANPDWFDSNSDTGIAFMLPLLTALMGMWLFRFMFPGLGGPMPLLEQLACGLGLGMMAVAAFTLGIKLCGFHGYHWVYLATGIGAIAELWHNRMVYGTGIADGGRKLVHHPITIAILAAGALVFLVLFRLAGMQGLVELDALIAWSLKAKIIHLYTGNDLVQWFSNPRIAQAHLDYPTLVPSLHAATYDSLGHVDEFVTKFWPAWMLLFLLAALASLNRAANNWRPVSLFALLGLLLLPVTQEYVQMEGGTMPMIFFTVMGFVQCAFWLSGKDRARLGLGLTLLFGAAMAKFEGFIFLALAGSWMLLVPSARPTLKPPLNFWRVVGFWILAALPFICLRVRIPVLHFESGWAGYALHNPGITLSTWPRIFMIQLARLFMSADFANWSGAGGSLHWIGRWNGLSSLYNHSTLGLPWLCLLLTVALWFAVPARRQVVIWTLAMVIAATAAFSLVFSSLLTVEGLDGAIWLSARVTGGRYLMPILLAWFATMMTLFFKELPSPASIPEPSRTIAPAEF
jgi:hypothetical protein